MNPTSFQENYLKQLLSDIMNKNNEAVIINHEIGVKKYLINTLTHNFYYKNNKGEIVVPKNKILL